MTDTRELVSITEAAQLLGISIRTVQRRLDAGQLEAVMVADKRMVRLTSDMPGVFDVTQANIPSPGTPEYMKSGSFGIEGDDQSAIPSEGTSDVSADAYGTTDDGGGLWRATSGVNGASAATPSHDMTRDIERVTEIVTSQEHTLQQFGRDIEQIKAYIAGDLGALLRERLANLPTRDDLAELAARSDLAAIPTREDIAETTGIAIGTALGPILDRLQVMEEERHLWRQERASHEATLASLQAKLDEAMKERETASQGSTATVFEPGGGASPPLPLKRPWWMFWAD